MSEQHEAFDSQELEVLSLACSKCGNVISFKVTTDETYGLPKRCPVCEEALGAAATAFMLYRKFYQAAAGLGIRLHTKSRAQ